MKCNNICIRWIPGKEEQNIENPFEKVMTEKFSSLMREKVIEVQKAHMASAKINPKRPAPRHIIIKIAKILKDFIYLFLER